MKNKKGLSAIIALLIIVALTLVAVSIVWVVVKGIVEEGIDESEACFGIFDEVSLNNDYTCYNPAGSLQFSINVGDIDIDELLVSIGSKTFKLNYEESSDVNGFNGGATILPGSNAGRTYEIPGVNEKPDSIKIAPVVSGVQCEVSDSLLEIGGC